MGFFDYFNNDLAIDLGTANTLIATKGSVVVDEPSIIAIDRITNKVLAIGSEAMQMHEKTHKNIKTIRPLKDGVIADFHAAEHMIRGMIKMIDGGKRFFPVSHRMVICIPSDFLSIDVIRPEGIVNSKNPIKEIPKRTKRTKNRIFGIHAVANSLAVCGPNKTESITPKKVNIKTIEAP